MFRISSVGLSLWVIPEGEGGPTGHPAHRKHWENRAGLALDLPVFVEYWNGRSRSPEGVDRKGLFIASPRLLHLQIESGGFRLGFGFEPVDSHLAGAADPSPLAHQAPIAKEPARDLDAIEPVQVSVWLAANQVHGLYPHILAAMSCSSLPTASA